MKTLLICHEDAGMDRRALARWMASFSELAGIIVLSEKRERKLRRIRREVRRVGALRFLDVLAFKLYYRLTQARADQEWEVRYVAEKEGLFAPLPASVAVLHTASPNSDEAQRFILQSAPDVMIARCKSLLNERIFSIPRIGTFVLHPGVCPEYRNAHGCFWAIANGERDKVGATLLKIDRGVDTGPVFGYFTYPYDERKESHIVIQHKVVMENLTAIGGKLQEIASGSAAPLDTAGRRSGEWGQPWLSRYWAAVRRRRPAP